MKGNEDGSRPRGRRALLGDLRSRVLGAMLLISLVPMSVVAYQGYHCARQAVIEQVHMHLVSVIEARRALLDEWLKERSAEIETLAALPHVLETASRAPGTADSEASGELARLLDSVQASSQSYESLMVYDAQWRIVARSSESNHQAEDIVTDAFRADIEQGEGVVMAEAHMHEEGNAGLHIGYPLRGQGAENKGFLVANLNFTKTLNPLLQERSGLWRTGKVYVVSSELTILTEPYRPDGGVAMNRATSPSVLECLSPEGPRVRQYDDYLGNRVLGTAMPLPVAQWMVVAEMDVDEALEWLARLLWRLGVTFGITLLLAVIVSVSISKFLGRPLKELARVAHRIRGGHVDERLGPISGVEAEAVRQAFNQMLDELRENQKEIVRNATLASVGELSTRIVHEMRNPLSSVKMNLQALTRVVENDEKNRELAEIASGQVIRVENMLTDLLHYGRPIELRSEARTFTELAEAALGVVTDLAKEKDVAIDIEDQTQGKPLYVDTEQICRALSNLLINAVQASPTGGRITLTARAFPEDDAFTQVEVCDVGAGLTKEALSNVFQPFFSTKSDGTGLGLANVKKVIELHGGAVSARNRPGGGAEFSFTLPARVAVTV